MSKASVSIKGNSLWNCGGSAPSWFTLLSKYVLWEAFRRLRRFTPNFPDRWEAAGVLSPSSPTRQRWSEAAGSEHVF